MLSKTRVVLRRYDRKENGLKIIYGLTVTPFGEAFIAVVSGKNEGVCQLHFGQKDLQAGQQHLKKYWPNASLCESNELIIKWTQRIFESTEETLDVIVNGTDFQIDVWNALLQIPFGETRTYSQVAEMIGKPRAVRAAASAVASNEIGFLIPCHRIISKDKKNVLKYAGGPHIKLKIMEYEQIKLN